MLGIIYKYTSPTNKSYIGQTIHEKVRMQRHKKAAIDGVDTKFCRAIRKYGWDNFKYEVLFTIDTDDIKHLKEKLDFMERYYIRKFHSYENGYNMTLGGGGAAGTKHTEEFKQRQSERMKNNNPAFNMTDEWRQHIGDSQRGKKKNDDFKQLCSNRMKINNPMKDPEVAKKVSLSKTGKHLSDEAKRKISEANKGIIRSKEYRQRHSEIAKARPRDAKGHFIKTKQ